MTTRAPRTGIPARTAVVVALAALALGPLTACGDDDAAAPATEAPTTTAPATEMSASATTTPSSTAGGAASTVAPTTAATTVPPAPSDTADIPLPPPVTSDMPATITVTVGRDSAPDRVEEVALGTTVVIAITDPSRRQEYHIHGYDLGDGQRFAAGQTATFTFTADRPGEFEVESHVTHDVLFLLRVV